MPKCDFNKVALQPVNLLHFFRTLFPRNSSGGLLLNTPNIFIYFNFNCTIWNKGIVNILHLYPSQVFFDWHDLLPVFPFWELDHNSKTICLSIRQAWISREVTLQPIFWKMVSTLSLTWASWTESWLHTTTKNCLLKCLALAFVSA